MSEYATYNIRGKNSHSRIKRMHQNNQHNKSSTFRIAGSESKLKLFGKVMRYRLK